MELNPALAIEHLENIINGLLMQTPNIIMALIVLLMGRPLAGWADRAVARLVRASGRTANAAQVFGRLARYSTYLAAIVLALVILLPGFTPSSTLSALGIGSVAIGFAFRDVLQNFLAGFLILLLEPFRIGDQIVVSGYEGTVQDIRIRATLLRTYDGRQIVIPNATVFTNAVTVNTAYRTIRSQYDITVEHGEDIEGARTLILDAIRSVEAVCTDPAPDVIIVGLADSTVNLRARWWSESAHKDILEVQSDVLQAIKEKIAADSTEAMGGNPQDQEEE